MVVGDSQTGEMDKVDGPYYFFGILAKLAKLPSFTPVLLPDTGRTNIVPVDYVIDALTELMHAPDRDGLTFHLTAPHSIGLHGIYRGFPRRPACLGFAVRYRGVPRRRSFERPDAPKCCAIWR